MLHSHEMELAVILQGATQSSLKNSARPEIDLEALIPTPTHTHTHIHTDTHPASAQTNNWKGCLVPA